MPQHVGLPRRDVSVKQASVAVQVPVTDSTASQDGDA